MPNRLVTQVGGTYAGAAMLGWGSGIISEPAAVDYSLGRINWKMGPAPDGHADVWLEFWLGFFLVGNQYLNSGRFNLVIAGNKGTDGSFVIHNATRTNFQCLCGSSGIAASPYGPASASPSSVGAVPYGMEPL